MTIEADIQLAAEKGEETKRTEAAEANLLAALHKIRHMSLEGIDAESMRKSLASINQFINYTLNEYNAALTSTGDQADDQA